MDSDDAAELCRHIERDRREQERLKAAARTLEMLGYVWNGGELWKPPLGPRRGGSSLRDRIGPVHNG